VATTLIQPTQLEKEMILNENYTLASGINIPKLGLGTWMIEGDAATTAVKAAIEMGYRHIDTAQDYFNEAEVGAGVRASGIDRSEVFVTSKLSAMHKNYDDAAAAIQKSLDLLDLDYIDLMIIHCPKPWDQYHEENRHFDGNIEAWRALEDAYKAGKIRSIGLSNFHIVDIENILENGSIKPEVNQILAHATNTPAELIEYCEQNKILVEAYSPIGHGELFKNEAISALAKKYEVSLPQLCIRYTLQLGLLPLPKTANPAHMKNNADVDFIISDEDMQTLKTMEKIENYGDASVFPVYQ
jgi:diketogulonate reductase-like aldo/keto reductase